MSLKLKYRFVAGVLTFCAGSALAEEPDALGAQIAQGQEIAQTHCSGCHAVGSSGASPHKDAPLFRNLARNYPLDSLQEALAEGIAVGHPDMPQFEFDPIQADALIAYLRSIQTPVPGAKPHDH